MSIRRAIAWLLGLGNARELSALEPPRRPDVPLRDRPRGAGEVRLYGEAEAIRVLYQTVLVEKKGPPKPRRPRGRRVPSLARFLDGLTSPLREPAGAKA